MEAIMAIFMQTCLTLVMLLQKQRVIQMQHVWTLMSIPLHTVHQEAQKQATMRVLQIDLLPATLRFLYLTIHMYLVGIEHILLPM